MIVLTTKCGRAKRHRLQIDKDGSMKLLDHNVRTLKSFAAFEATPPKCFEIYERYQDNPIECLTDLSLFNRKKVLSFIADWLDRALPYYDTLVPNDQRLLKAIDGVRRGLHGLRGPVPLLLGDMPG